MSVSWEFYTKRFWGHNGKGLVQRDSQLDCSGGRTKISNWLDPPLQSDYLSFFILLTEYFCVTKTHFKISTSWEDWPVPTGYDFYCRWHLWWGKVTTWHLSVRSGGWGQKKIFRFLTGRMGTLWSDKGGEDWGNSRWAQTLNENNPVLLLYQNIMF